MVDSVAGLLKFGFLICLALVALLAAAAFARNVLQRALSPGVVQIARFPDLKDEAKDRAPLLLARAQELGKPVRLDALYEVNVPPLTSRFGLKDDLKFLDDVKINVQGVDLPDLIKKLFAAVPDDQPVVTAASEPAAKGSAVRLEWKEPSGKKYSWLLSSALPSTEPKATTEIIDQAIYAMVYHMYYEPAVAGTPQGVKFSSRRALEAYYSAQQHLGAYQRSREAAELDAAEKELRVLYQEMPGFVDGMMLLGITLLEKKNEPDAIVIFERVLRTFPAGAADRAALASDRKKALYSALLFRASALRKQYHVTQNHRALEEIERLIELMAAAQPAAGGGAQAVAPATDESQDFRKLRISALSEKAYILGAYLILLNEVNFIDALKTAAPPAQGARDYRDAVALSVADSTLLLDLAKRVKDGAADASQARQQILQHYRAKAGAIHQALGTVVTQARTLIGGLPSDEAGMRARGRFGSDLENAAAYAQYRHAAAVEDNDEAFTAACRAALEKLEEAHATSQNEQSILLNLGLIAGDPRCDPDGRNIAKAKTYLEDAIKLKQNDYYAHQLLATLCIRQVYTFGREFTPADVITRAVAAADAARMLRPQEGTIFAILAQAYVLQYAADEGKKPLIEAALGQAEKRGATPIHLHIARLQYMVQQAAKADTDDKREVLRKQLDAEIPLAITASTGNRTFYGKLLLRDANALGGMLQNLKTKDLQTLRWPL